MTIELKKIAGIGAVVAALAAGPVMAQEIGEWDTDTDGALNAEEFNTGWNAGFGEGETAFSTWDEDDDGALSEDEYNAGVFSSYDDDASGVIEEPEYGDVGDDMGDGGFWDV
jgi:opacity protein-like surface antigen